MALRYSGPKEDALLPYQLENKVAWPTYVSGQCFVPAPEVYACSLENNPFIAKEYIEGDRLSGAWRKYDES